MKSRPESGEAAIKRRALPACTAALVAALAAVPIVSAQQRGTRIKAPGLEARVCDWKNESGRVAHCFWLVVPERWDKPGAKTVRLPVVVFRAPDKDRKNDPVVFVNGGPGVVSSTGGRFARWWNRRLRQLSFVRNRDLIIYDQRGVGGARPSLACPEILKTRPDPLNVRLQRAAAAACAKRLRQNGIDLAAYSTHTNARDLAELRRQLRIPTWNLWGQSYGSRVVLQVLRRHPEGVRSVILDGPYPPQVGRSFNWGAPTVRIIERLLRLCAGRNACIRRLTAPRPTWIKLLERLRKTPLIVVSRPGFGLKPIAWKINDVTFMWLLQDTLYSARGLRRLPAVLHMLNTGVPNHKLLRRMTSNFDLNVFGPFFVHGVAWTVSCNDNPKADVSVERRIARDHPHLRRWINDMLAVNVCPLFNPGGKPMLDFSAVRSDIPTLIVSGELDVATPAGWARVAAEKLSRSTILRFRGASHDVSDHSCAQYLMRRFLDAPGRKLDTHCVANVAPFRFDWRGVGSRQ